MLISRWGNSLAVRLPKALVEELGLKEGDEVRLVKANDKLSTLTVEKPKKHELLEKLRAFRGTIPAGYKFDREEANRRGRWDDP